MAKIFISYKRIDKDKVFPIVEEIKQKSGVDCWIDLEGIESGDQFQNVIIDAIDNADIVVFMLSKNFIAPFRDEKTGLFDLKKQTFPEKEVMYALRHNKRLIPISIDETSVYDCKWLEFNCSGLDCIDWRSYDQRNKLIHNIMQWSGIVNNESGNENNPFEKPVLEGFPNDSKLSFLNNAITKNKGCAIVITVAFVLCVVVLPLKYLTYVESNKNKITCVPNSAQRKSRNVAASSPSVPQVKNDRSEVSAPSTIGCDAVDLGLSSGTLWADRNVGAKESKDYGGLYAWGEIEVKDNFYQSSYGDGHLSNIIGTKHDVCTIELGAGWQLPTQKQFDELIEECKWEWCNNGITVIGKNGQSIFLPASGWSCSSNIEYRNQYGYYWTGDKVNTKFAKGLLFSKSSKKTGNGYLYYGRSVRAVKKQ